MAVEVNNNKIKYLNYPKISDISQEEIRLTIDTLEDLNIFKEIIVGLQDKNISLDNVLEYLKMHPDLKNRMKIINEDNKK